MRKTLCAAVLACTANVASAGGIPVIDVASIAQLIQQFNEMQQQRAVLENQLNQLQGSTGMGALLENPAQHALRRYAPSVADMANVVGGTSSSPATSYAQALIAVMSMDDPATLFAGSDPMTSRLRTQYGRERETYVSAYGVAAASYDQAPQRTGTVESLSGQIDSASSVKSAIDLQNRLSAENAHLLNEVARLQAAQLRADSEARAAELARRNKARANIREVAGYFWAATPASSAP